MITCDFEYMVVLFEREHPASARLSWNCSDKYGEYFCHTLLIDHIKGSAFNVAKGKALEIMEKDYPNATFRVRDVFASCVDNKFYLQFRVESIGQR